MGEVLITYRVMPEGPETDIAALEETIRNGLPSFATLQKCEAVPFAFGMKCLNTVVVVEDEEGNNDKLEEILANTAGVQGIELLDMGRL